MPRSVPIVVVTLLGIGCEGPIDPLHPLAWEGDRVVFGTNRAEDVCAGTLASLDASVASIELELELEPQDRKIEFFLLDDPTIERECGPSLLACLLDGRVFSSKSGFEYKRHELVHALVGVGGEQLFDEGLASALDQRGGCLASEICAAVDLDALLEVGDVSELANLRGYVAGADLVHGMLVTYGPQDVLAFITELTRDTPPDAVRSSYLEHFGGVLDEDFQAFMRGPFDDFTVAQRGCDGLVRAPSGEDGRGVEIHAVMDCGSTDVVNLFGDPPRGIIEWTFEVTPEQSGAFVATWSAEELVFVEGCDPPEFDSSELADFGPYTFAWRSSKAGPEPIVLAAGQYTIRWPSDFGTTLDFTLMPQCMFEFGGCPVGQQCNIWNECRPQAESPAALGEPCEQVDDAPLACQTGSRCMGGVCVAECDATQPCGVGRACSRLRTCGPICDLLEQDCGDGYACLPSEAEDLDASGMGVCVAAGEGEIFDECDWRESECRVGTSCERVGGVYGFPCAELQPNGGCCVPFCDPSLDDPGCPLETPTCDRIREGSVGVCQS
ncbi:hypothetical protein ACNOYE_20200 [Nannocystaceae bacterium ST9]